jgi:hypothetical protein
MPYVTDDDRFSLCTENTNLGELGPGFPLFFQFMKYISGLMVGLTIVYFIPCIVLLVLAFRKFGSDGLDPK